MKNKIVTMYRGKWIMINSIWLLLVLGAFTYGSVLKQGKLTDMEQKAVECGYADYYNDSNNEYKQIFIWDVDVPVR